MWNRRSIILCSVLLGNALGGCLSTAANSSEPHTHPSVGNSSINDQDATFEVSVDLRVSAPLTTYDRTAVGLDTSLPVELVDMVDETRGIRAKSIGRETRLEQLFGSKSGLADHMTIRAVVRVRGQPGEKTVRKTVWFRTVPVELLTKAESRGSLGVMVEIDVPIDPESNFNPEASLLKRQKISQAQDQLLKALQGTEYKIIRRFDMIPGFVLDASPATLLVLDRLPTVLKVSEDMSHIIRIP